MDEEQKMKDEEEKISNAQIDWDQLGGVISKQEIIEQQKELERIQAQNKPYEQEEVAFP